MTNFKKALFFALFLSGCGFFQKGVSEPEISKEPRYNAETPISLKVSNIEIVSEFSPTFRRPNVEHLMPVSIEKTARLWANDRLVAADKGSTNVAKYVIEDASVTEELEKSTRSFYKDSVKYRANLKISLLISDTKTLSSAKTSVHAWHELKIPADTSIAEKEQYWNAMVKKLFDKFDAEMTKNIHEYLARYANP